MFDWLYNIFRKKESLEDTPQEMKYLIVGIGNKGLEYDGTRHNIGFEVLDFMAHEFGVGWKNDTLGDLTQLKHKGRQIYLLKPSTYVNRSGKAVRHWMTKHKIITENLLIVVDDLNLDFQKIRLRDKGSDGGHNGLKDIQQTLGNNKFPRLRIGIGDNFRKGQQVDFVLGKWSKKEIEGLQTTIPSVVEIIKNFCTIGLKFTKDKIKN